MDGYKTASYTNENNETFVVLELGLGDEPKKRILYTLLESKGIKMKTSKEITYAIFNNLENGTILTLSQRQIAALCGKSPGSVNKTIRNLMRIGLIEQKGRVYIINEEAARLFARENNVGIMYR